MGLAYGESKVKFREATAAQNKILPIHRWVPWVAGFSAQLVEDEIDAYLPKQGRSRKLVLDPFAGVGTTLVEALMRGRKGSYDRFVKQRNGDNGGKWPAVIRDKMEARQLFRVYFKQT